ncbi:unnamed protein product [Darwinula stevensoni]|uniref:Potassium channel domain-containing protein n=1 Tax=Darwinula stevensoni TaxID=69355 RepID=A0A7R8XBF5_9CRUS|nr:unnamed protein product [Darwinula stevensoni]CAG0892771.1 unnamed protein product [Darwinula stevensoni]
MLYDDRRTYDYYAKQRPLWKIILGILFSHVGLFFLVAGYAVAGAYLFIYLEMPAEERRKQQMVIQAEQVDDSITYLADLFWYYQDNYKNVTIWRKKVSTDLDRFKDFLIGVVQDTGYTGTKDVWDYSWTFPKTLLFTITILTTIGYGNITPKTFYGKIFTIIYALFGIPLLLVFLANIGDSMASTVTLVYRYQSHLVDRLEAFGRLCCRWCRARRKKSELPPGVTEPPKGERLIDDDIGKEEYMPTNDVVVPIMLNLLIIALYIMLGAILFNQWEGWDFTTSSYFTFVTVATIGFGDYVPGNSFLEYKDGVSAMLKMITTVLYCLFGMALVSMAINLMQAQLLAKAKWFAKEVGLSDDSEEFQLPPIEILRRQAKKKRKPLQTPNEQKLKKPLKAVSATAESSRPDTASLVRLSERNGRGFSGTRARVGSAEADPSFAAF